MVRLRWVDAIGASVVLVGLVWAALTALRADDIPRQAEEIQSNLAAHAAAMPVWLLPLWEQEGLVFVSIPAGDFQMGTDAGALDDDEMPVHTLFLDEYWIGLTEVTNVQFQRFVEAGGYDTAAYWTDSGWLWRTSNQIAMPDCWRSAGPGTGYLPVQCVTWYEAVAYTRWLSQQSGLSVRLPTEAEWEKAAHGPAFLRFPWGNQEPQPTLANLAGAADQFAHAAPVGSFPAGASVYGVLDMSGNVWEWTSTRYADYPYIKDERENLDGKFDRVVRGGGWLSKAAWATTTSRFKDDPDDSDGLQGFRVVVDPPIGESK